MLWQVWLTKICKGLLAKVWDLAKVFSHAQIWLQHTRVLQRHIDSPSLGILPQLHKRGYPTKTQDLIQCTSGDDANERRRSTVHHWILKAQTPDMNLQPTSPMSRRMFLATDEVQVTRSVALQTEEPREQQHISASCCTVSSLRTTTFDPTLLPLLSQYPISRSFRLFPMKFARSAWAGRRRPKT